MAQIVLPMKPLTQRLLLWVALPVLLMALAVWSWAPREPSWEGRSLSEWLIDLEPDRNGKMGAVGEQNATAAKLAIRGMGTNCISFLLRRIDYLEPTWLDRLVAKLEAQLRNHGVRIPWKTAEPDHLGERMNAIILAMNALGHEAAPIVPQLQGWLASDNEDKGYAAAGMLPYIHPEGTAVLISAYTNPAMPARFTIRLALPHAARMHPEVMPVFLGMASHPHPAIREDTSFLLQNCEKHAPLVLPVLIRLLGDPVSSVRETTIHTLTHFKADVSAAVPALMALTTDPDPEISSKAKALLLKIKAQSATPPSAP